MGAGSYLAVGLDPPPLISTPDPGGVLKGPVPRPRGAAVIAASTAAACETHKQTGGPSWGVAVWTISGVGIRVEIWVHLDPITEREVNWRCERGYVSCVLCGGNLGVEIVFFRCVSRGGDMCAPLI